MACQWQGAPIEVPSDLPFLPSWFSGKSPPSMKGNMKLITYWRWDNISSSTSPQFNTKFLASKPSRRNFWSRDWSRFIVKLCHVGYKGMWKIEESLGSHSDFMGTLLQPLRSYTRSSVVLVSVTHLNPHGCIWHIQIVPRLMACKGQRVRLAGGPALTSSTSSTAPC